MSYFAPYIDSTGIHIPSYADIKDKLIDDFKGIYGKDIYLENDSQDYQMISAFALMLNDNYQMLELVFNSYSVKSATGTPLDALVKLNGIYRKSASYSTAELLITGAEGTVITNGMVKDIGGNSWMLDSQVTIGEGGTAQCSATCTALGNIEAPANTITKINTPTKGWTGVTNPEKAAQGSPIESDAELKSRQSYSVKTPSLNMVESLYAALSALDNVQDCKIFDNDTSVAKEGVPPHSVACIVLGGDDMEIASAIYKRKGPGAGTASGEFGVSEGLVTKTISTVTGNDATIGFYRPVDVPIDVIISISRTALFTTQTEQSIRQAVKAYFDNMTIGTYVRQTSIIAVVQRVISDIYSPEFILNLPIRMGRSGESAAARDFTDIAINQKAVLGELIIQGI